MSVLSGQTIERMGLVTPCRPRSTFHHPDPLVNTMTFGVGPAGYDLRLDWGNTWSDKTWILEPGEFRLGATIERFTMPDHVTGMVYDKSSWARRGLSLFNTILEPGWFGHLTLELKNLGNERLFLPQGVPIAQVVFQYLDESTFAPYCGKYQNQESGPQTAR